MITQHPDVPFNFFILDSHKSIGDYARAYGDEIARRYENYDAIYFPHFPLNFDLEFFQNLRMPADVAKIGTTNGIENSLYKRGPDSISHDPEHVLFKLYGMNPLAGYAQHQIQSVNGQISEALRALFPRYFSLARANITYRLTETKDGGLHFDVFKGGRPFGDANNMIRRIKLFINVDTKPRHWHTSFTLRDALVK